MRVKAALGTTVAAILIFCSIEACTQSREAKNVGRIFEDLGFHMKSMSGQIRLTGIPSDVERLIGDGSVSLNDLRFLARTGTVTQKVWAVFCIGRMSRQQLDIDFLKELRVDRDFYKSASPNTELLLADLMEQAIGNIDAAISAERTGTKRIELEEELTGKTAEEETEK